MTSEELTVVAGRMWLQMSCTIYMPSGLNKAEHYKCIRRVAQLSVMSSIGFLNSAFQAFCILVLFGTYPWLNNIWVHQAGLETRWNIATVAQLPEVSHFSLAGLGYDNPGC